MFSIKLKIIFSIFFTNFVDNLSSQANLINTHLQPNQKFILFFRSYFKTESLYQLDQNHNTLRGTQRWHVEKQKF
jgi:hypothetical protein